MMWVRKEPKYLGKHRYIEVPDTLYQQLKNATFWIDDNGNYTLEKPYTFKYHTLINGVWKLDHDKVNAHIVETKDVFKNNVSKYQSLGLSDTEVDYLNQQIDKLSSLDEVEEYSLIALGGVYESVYTHRYRIGI